MWRKAHGSIAGSGRTIASETRPADELPQARPPKKPRPARDRDSRGRFQPRNGVALTKRMTIREPKGMLKELEERAPADWAKVRRYGRDACRHRINELARIHGDLSAGVCSVLADGYDQRADAKYIRTLAAAEGGDGGEKRPGMVELLRLSIQLSASARQAERDAWELAVREARARPPERPRGVAMLLSPPERVPPVPPKAPRGSLLAEGPPSQPDLSEPTDSDERDEA